MTERYLFVSSEFRDRTNHPSYASFIVPSAAKASQNFKDPLVAELPITTNVTDAGSTSLTIVLSPLANSTTNFYNSMYLEIGGELRTIISYTYPNATVSSPFSSAPAPFTPYAIREKTASYRGTTVAASYGRITLDASSSPISGFYNSFFVRMTSGAQLGSYAKILSYDGATNVALIRDPEFIVSPLPGDTYEICKVTGDNFNSTNFTVDSKTPTSGKKRLKLLSLSLPNKTLYNRGGGSILDRSHVMLTIRSSSAVSSTNSNISNSSTATAATFIVPVDPVQSNNKFITLVSNMQPVIDLNLGSTLTFVYSLMDGTLLDFGEDRKSPFTPEPNLQISALIQITDEK